MSVLLRFLGLAEPTPPESRDEPLARIAAELDGLPPERARFFACFAYVLARVADADLAVDETEVAEMEELLVRCAGIGREEAALAARIARSQVDRLGATQNYLVTQEFGRLSTPQERLRLIECLFAVAAADDTISGVENDDVFHIASEIGVARSDVLAIRSGFRDKLATLRRLPGEAPRRDPEESR